MPGLVSGILLVAVFAAVAAAAGLLAVRLRRAARDTATGESRDA